MTIRGAAGSTRLRGSVSPDLLGPMNRHGRRFIELRDFRSHAKSLNVKSLKDDELEFYEKHCLLLPAVVCYQSTAHLVAVTQRSNGWPVKNPEDLEPPEALRRLQRLEPIRSICEQENIPAQLANEGDLSIWHLRETQSLRHGAQRHGTALLRPGDLKAWIDRQQAGRWVDLLAQALEEHELETGGAEVPAASFVEWLAEWCRDTRRRQRGLLLLTAHRAKGLEFDHVVVLDGGWDRRSRREDADAPRRLYYVAMTRAKQTLTLTRLRTAHPFHSPLNDNPAVQWRPPAALPTPTPEMARRYRTLTLKDVDLGFAGRRPPSNRVHRSIRILTPGDRLQTRRRHDRWELLDSAGMPVGALARSYDTPDNLPCTQARVAAVATWNKDRSDPQYRENLHCDHWEVVIPELTFEPAD